MKLLAEEAFIMEVRYTAPNTEKGWPSRVNFDVQGANGRLSLSLDGGTQDDFKRLSGLSMKLVSIESDLSIRRVGNNQFISLVNPKITRVGASAPAPEAVKS